MEHETWWYCWRASRDIPGMSLLLTCVALSEISHRELRDVNTLLNCSAVWKSCYYSNLQSKLHSALAFHYGTVAILVNVTIPLHSSISLRLYYMFHIYDSVRMRRIATESTTAQNKWYSVTSVLCNLNWAWWDVRWSIAKTINTQHVFYCVVKKRLRDIMHFAPPQIWYLGVWWWSILGLCGFGLWGWGRDGHMV